jgi:UDP-N-acetyl-D-mannosaminuronic acid dehydrogenase
MEPLDLLEKVRARDFTLGVVGLGRVGLPLALAFATKGIRVIGVDVDPRRIEQLQQGEMPFKEIGGQEALASLGGTGRFQTSTTVEPLAEADAIFITVGTVLNNELRPDYSQINSALNNLSSILRPVQLLMLRSTVSPGTLSKVVARKVEGELGLKVGRDILLASTPERISAGHALEELPNLPELVGGIDEISGEVAAAVMQTLNPAKQVHVTTSMQAELSKLFTNVYRYVTFALANEFALLAEAHGVDAHEIIRISNQGYPRGGIPLPGPCGGPCLTKDGYFLVEDLTFPDFIMTAWKLNEGVPAHVTRRLKQRLEVRGLALSGARVTVLGMGFKAEIDDTRASPAIRLADILRNEGAIVTVTDPYHDTPSLRQALVAPDAVVLATNHVEYRDLSFLDAMNHLDPKPILVDCWGMWDEDRVRTAGFELIVFGAGDEPRVAMSPALQLVAPMQEAA